MGTIKKEPKSGVHFVGLGVLALIFDSLCHAQTPAYTYTAINTSQKVFKSFTSFKCSVYFFPKTLHVQVSSRITFHTVP